VIADKRHPRTGGEYIKSLRHGREVYIDGERQRRRENASPGRGLARMGWMFRFKAAAYNLGNQCES
jgi:hypothetical protein